MAWDDKSVAQAVRLMLPKAVLDESGGLAQVVDATLARVGSSGGLGDIIDIFEWVFCYVQCVGDLLWCIFTHPKIPGTGNLNIVLCVVLWGGCNTICKINTPF